MLLQYNYHPWNSWPALSFPEGAWPLTPLVDVPGDGYKEKVRPNFSVPTRPFYSTDEEYEVYRQIAAEYYSLLYPSVPIMRVDRKVDVFDNPIFEVEDDQYSEAIYVPGYIRWNPDVRQLNRFGMEGEQDASVVFPDVLLREAGIEDLEHDLTGAVVALPMANQEYRFFEVRTVSKRPSDVVTPFGHSFNVELSLTTKDSDAFHRQYNGTTPFFDMNNRYEALPNPLFYDFSEMELLRSIADEGFQMTLPTIPIKPIDREKTPLSSPVRESESKVYKDVVYVPGHIQWNPTVFDLRKFGIVHDQEVLITFPLGLLQEATEIDELRELEGGLVTLDIDQEGHRTEYEIITVNYQSVDARSVFGHVTQVAMTVNLHHRPWQSESKAAPIDNATEDEAFLDLSKFEDHGIF